MKSKQHSFVYPYLFLTLFLWGSLYVVSKHVLGKVPPFTLSLLRYVIAVVVLFLLVRIKNYAPLERKYYKQILLIGFFGYFLSQVLQFMGTKLSNASFAALINSLNPVAIMVMAAVFLHEKLTAQKIAGLALSLGGVYIILGGGHSDGMTAGIALSLLSVFIWSLVSVGLCKLSVYCPPLLIVAWGTAVALIFAIPCAFIELIYIPVTWDWSVLISVLYMGVMCTAVAHLLWNKSLSLAEAGTCSAFYPVQPLSAAALGAVFLGESVTSSFWAGAALIIGGVMISLKKKQGAR